MKITSIKTYPLAMPRTIPTGWSVGSRKADKPIESGLLIEIDTDKDIIGYGESVGPAIFARKTIVDNEFTPLLLGKDPRKMEKIYEKVKLIFEYNPLACWAYSGVEMALWDIKAKKLQVRVVDLLGGPVRDEVEYNGYLFINPSEFNAKRAKDFISHGYRSLKVKVGKNIDQDYERLRTIREAVGDQVSIRIDANGAWKRREAIQNIKKLQEFSLEFVEDPLSRWDIEGMKFVRAHIDVPLAADESCGLFREAINLHKNEACDVFVIYVSQAGGIANAKRIADFASEVGINCVMGSASEMGVATLAQMQVIAACSSFTLSNDTHYSIQKDDIIEPKLNFDKGGRLPIPINPGLGVGQVDKEKLKQYAAEEGGTPSYTLFDEVPTVSRD